MSKVARHPRHPAVVNMSLEDISQRYTVRFADIKPDWSVFGDSNFDGYRRAQFRYIGQTLGKPEVRHIPAGATRSRSRAHASSSSSRICFIAMSIYHRHSGSTPVGPLPEGLRRKSRPQPAASQR